RVDPGIDRRGDELDTAAVTAARHAGPRVASSVELGLGLLGHEVEQCLYVAALIARVVDLDSAPRLAEAPRIPGDDVVSVVDERVDVGDAERPSERARSTALGVARLAPARPLKDGRGAM